MEDSDMRPPAPGGELQAGRGPRATATARVTARTRIVLGSIGGLLLIAAILYYIVGRDAASDLAWRNQTSEGPQATTVPRQPNGADPTQQTASPQASVPSQPGSPEPVLAQPSSSQQSSSQAAPPVEETPLTPRSVTTSRILQSDDRSALTANERPDNRAAVPTTSPMTSRATALPNDVVLVVQRARANIRTEPSRKGRVIGTAAKGTQVKVISRSRNWIEVEVGGGRGWITGDLLGPRPDQ